MQVKSNALLTKQKANKPSISNYMLAPSVQKLLMTAVGGDKERAGNYTSAIVNAVSVNPELKSCDPNSVFGAALAGISAGLSMQRHEFAIVPYGDVATCIIQYQGLVQSASRTGEYFMNPLARDVREGEYVGVDNDTWEPVFCFMPECEERQRLPIIGYVAKYILKGGNPKGHAVYWSYEKILQHADQYVPAFSYEKYQKMLKGEIPFAKPGTGSAWNFPPNSEGHMKMCKKTVLRQLLTDGTAPMTDKLKRTLDTDIALDEGPIIFPDVPTTEDAMLEVEQMKKEHLDEQLESASKQLDSNIVDVEPVTVEPVQEQPKQEAPKQEAPKQEAPKQEAPKQEAPKAKPGRAARPKKEVPEEEPVPMQGDLSQYMNPPVNTDGLPFN